MFVSTSLQVEPKGMVSLELFKQEQKNAIRDTGGDVEILYSEWQSDRMIQQLREQLVLESMELR